METKLTVIPFDLGKAKMIQGRINSARIITRAGRNVRAVVFNMKHASLKILSHAKALNAQNTLVVYVNNF